MRLFVSRHRKSLIAASLSLAVLCCAAVFVKADLVNRLRQSMLDSQVNANGQAMIDEGRQDVPLRHVRRRGVLGRHAAAAPGDRRRGERRRRPRRRARRRRSRSASRSTSDALPPSVAATRLKAGKVDLDDPGDDARAAQAQRGRRRERLLRRRRRD